MVLIGLTGLAGSGKTTAADALVQNGFERLSFATPLKEMLEALGVPPESLWGCEKEFPLEAFGGLTGRRMMQTLGTEWGRALRPDFWHIIYQNNLHGLSAMGVTEIVTDDVRFPDEADLIRSLGGAIVKIVRTDHVATRETGHPSEAAQSLVRADFTIENTGSVEDLGRAVVSIANTLRQQSSNC